MSPRFEIGVVYKKGSRYCLAVSENTLITFKDGKLQEVRPYAKYDVVRSISVETLCKLWGVSLETLDKQTSKYLAPSNEGIRPRPRGSRRRAAADEALWRNLRLTRLRAG
jgi:hypothetical protein